jgi:hypothetical protein
MDEVDELWGKGDWGALGMWSVLNSVLVVRAVLAFREVGNGRFALRDDVVVFFIRVVEC